MGLQKDSGRIAKGLLTDSFIAKEKLKDSRRIAIGSQKDIRKIAKGS